MDVESDMIVLVVVGDDQDSKSNSSMDIRELSENSLDIKELIETATKHGEFITVKEEPEDNDCDYIDDEMLQNVIKSEQIDEYYQETEDDAEEMKDYDSDYDPLEVNKYEAERYSNKEKFRLAKAGQQKSFVAELRQEYPELNEDEELLLHTLEQIMRNVKPPPPPRDYYIMNGILFECVECGALTETIPTASRHYQEKHGTRYLVCFACGVDFRSTTNLYKHEKRCTAPDAYTVLRARAAFIGRKGRGRPYVDLKPIATPKRKRERRTADGKKREYPCELCSAVFVTNCTLESHMNLHRGERPFRCHVCTAAYTSYSALSRHTKTHLDLQFICDYCNRCFNIKAALVSHMDTHNPIRKYGCKECSRRYAQKAALLLHVNKVHRNLPPPCACQICPKRYPRMSLLKAHMKREHGLSIITRKMFLKSLPTMTDLEVKQSKIILKDEGEIFADESRVKVEDDVESNYGYDDCEFEIEVESSNNVGDNNFYMENSEVVEYVHDIKSEVCESSDVQVEVMVESQEVVIGE